ncbi:unnamed protein product, partial [Prorocentrum cordatum]
RRPPSQPPAAPHEHASQAQPAGAAPGQRGHGAAPSAEPPPRPPAAAADGGFASNGRASGGRGASRAGAALRLQRWWRDCLEARGALFEGLVVELMELRAGAAEDTGGPAGVARLHPEAAGPRRSGVAGVTAARRPRDGAVVPARPSRSDAVAARLPLALGSLCLLRRRRRKRGATCASSFRASQRHGCFCAGHSCTPCVPTAGVRVRRAGRRHSQGFG